MTYAFLVAGTVLILYTGVVSWIVCLLYTVFGRWYASLTGWVMFSLPFQFGMSALYLGLRRAEVLPEDSASWLGFIIFLMSAISVTAFLVLLIKETKIFPMFKHMLASMDKKH